MDHDLRAVMRALLDQTLNEANARLTGHWAGDVRAYDATVDHAGNLADSVSDAIAKQFPHTVR